MEELKTKAFSITFCMKENHKIIETHDSFSVIITQYGENGVSFSHNHFVELEKALMKLSCPNSGMLIIRHLNDIVKCEKSPFGMIESLKHKGYNFPSFDISDKLFSEDEYGTKTFKKFVVNMIAELNEIEKYIWSYYKDSGIRWTLPKNV